jgi:hypothetical protein
MRGHPEGRRLPELKEDWERLPLPPPEWQSTAAEQPPCCVCPSCRRRRLLISTGVGAFEGVMVGCMLGLVGGFGIAGVEMIRARTAVIGPGLGTLLLAMLILGLLLGGFLGVVYGVARGLWPGIISE